MYTIDCRYIYFYILIIPQIKVHTTIGFGSEKAGTHGVHGSPLGEADLANLKKKFGFDPSKKFFVPEEVSFPSISSSK